jgi:hypothetical protein
VSAFQFFSSLLYPTLILPYSHFSYIPALPVVFIPVLFLSNPAGLDLFVGKLERAGWYLLACSVGVIWFLQNILVDTNYINYTSIWRMKNMLWNDH